ncbi:LytTR family DNA-binding domain-containing protein [Mycoplasmatota bacterium WC44]
MKVRLLVKKENKEQIMKDILNGNIEFTDDGDFLLVEENFKKEEIVGRIDDSLELIRPLEIIYVESYDQVSNCITTKGKYQIKEKLYEIENLFYEQGLIRVSKSYVINKNMIDKIKVASFNMKFLLRMKNGFQIDVTRSYYYKFKEYIGL